MSIGFGRSYQHAGLNRLGAYQEVSRDKGPRTEGNEGENGGKGDTDKPNEIWRRITGIFPGVKQSAKDRKRGLKLLSRRIQERVRRAGPHLRPRSDKGRGENDEGWPGPSGRVPQAQDSITCSLDGADIFSDSQSAGNGILSPTRPGPLGRATQGPEAATGSEPRAAANGGLEISLVSEWEFDSATWTRVANCGITVEALCVELGCTRHILTSLLKEHCGMSAAEFLDGLKFSRLRTLMMGRLRDAATELWGFPGSYVGVKLCAERRAESLLCDPDQPGPHPRPLSHMGRGENGKRLRYFQTRPEELFEESLADERTRRVSEICAMLHHDFNLESWAISAGYESGAKLKRACLNVLGRTLEKLERALATEVVQFYLCAEDRELREMALSDDGSVIVGRARELYHGDDAKPEAPFVDEYAKFEELKAEWLSRMWDVFNGNDQ